MCPSSRTELTPKHGEKADPEANCGSKSIIYCFDSLLWTIIHTLRFDAKCSPSILNFHLLKLDQLVRNTNANSLSIVMRQGSGRRWQEVLKIFLRAGIFRINFFQVFVFELPLEHQLDWWEVFWRLQNIYQMSGKSPRADNILGT